MSSKNPSLRMRLKAARNSGTFTKRSFILHILCYFWTDTVLSLKYTRYRQNVKFCSIGNKKSHLTEEVLDEAGLLQWAALYKRKRNINKIKTPSRKQMPSKE